MAARDGGHGADREARGSLSKGLQRSHRRTPSAHREGRTAARHHELRHRDPCTDRRAGEGPSNTGSARSHRTVPPRQRGEAKRFLEEGEEPWPTRSVVRRSSVVDRSAPNDARRSKRSMCSTPPTSASCKSWPSVTSLYAKRSASGGIRSVAWARTSTSSAGTLSSSRSRSKTARLVFMA